MRTRNLLVVVAWWFLCTLASASTISRVKTWANGDILTAADLNAEFNNIVNDYNGSVSTANFATTLTWSATGNQYLDISAIASSTTKGIRLPTGSTGGTNAGQVAWDNTAKALRVGDGSAANFDVLTAAQGTAGQLLRSAGGNALQTWTTPTYPNTGGTAGQWLRTDGTNYGLSTPTLPNAAPTNGQLLIGDGTNYALATLTAGSGITVTNGAGSITIASPAYTSRDGTFTRDVSLTTTLTVTTTGVNPSRCDFTLSNNAVGAQGSWGRSTSVPSAGQGYFVNAGGTGGNWDGMVGVAQFVASAGNQTLFTMSSYGTAQYVLAFTKTGTPTGTAYVTWRCESAP